MFEKEVEEYANGKGHEHYNYLFEEHAGSPSTFANWCFKDGAEFGYNKAKEEMQAQIEKMKCCENCKHHYWAGGADLCCRLRENECKDMIKLEKWELEENDE